MKRCGLVMRTFGNDKDFHHATCFHGKTSRRAFQTQRWKWWRTASLNGDVCRSICWLLGSMTHAFLILSLSNAMTVPMITHFKTV